MTRMVISFDSGLVHVLIQAYKDIGRPVADSNLNDVTGTESTEVSCIYSCGVTTFMTAFKRVSVTTSSDIY